MKLSEYAKRLGLKYQTAYAHFRAGLIPNAYQLETGTIIVPDPALQSNRPSYTVVYARVSSNDRKNQMETQADRVVRFCEANGWTVNEIVKECASGLNDKRPKLQKILQERKATRIVVENKDRLTRFGFEYLKTLLNDCEIVVMNEAECCEEDLMGDFVSIVTCFCARIYGLRRSGRKVKQVMKALEEE